MKIRTNCILLFLGVISSVSSVGAQNFLRADEAADRQLQEECNPTTGEGTRSLQSTCPSAQIGTGGREPWDPLNSSERSYVRSVLSNELDLVTSNNPFLTDEIRGVALEEPNKAETLAYLDDNGPPPRRFARGTVYLGSKGYIQEYLVGPLPFPEFSTSGTDVTVTEARPQGEISLTSLQLSGDQYGVLAGLVSNFVNTPVVKDFLNEAFGSTSDIQYTTHEYGLEKNRTNNVPVSWYRPFGDMDNILSHPLPFEVMVEFTDYADPGSWRLHSIIYNFQFFPENQDFIDALNAGTVTIKELPVYEENPYWQTLDKRPSLRPNNCAPPASNIEPGARYSVDGGWVFWLGWSFHVTNRPRTAIALHDVSFLGERIAYELSLQELQAFYSGYTPSMANKALFDTDFYFGASNAELVEGVDCPKGAYIFGATCIFEHDKGVPVWRKDGGRPWYAGAKGTHLVVRTMFEVGNYDYMAEFKFGLDGQVDIGFAATGQLFMSAYGQEQEPYGSRVHNEALANLHAHYAGFKVDLDVLGVTNCVEKEAIVYKERTSIPGQENQPAWNVPLKNLAVEREIVQNENDARVIVDNQAPVNWKVVSCNETNQWGYLKGYEIVHPNTPVAIYPEAFPGYQAYHTVFAQRKEEEPYLTTQFDSVTRAEPYVPITGPGGISNGQTLVEQDIVAWVGLGFYHLPRAEDNPVTNVVQSHFAIRPFNYYDENPSVDVGQTVRYKDGQMRNNVPMGNCTADL